MTGIEDRFEANPRQAHYWNIQAGPTWVRHDDAMNARLQPLTMELLSRASLQAGEKVLEVGCGGGSTTEALAAAVGPTGEVLAVDISDPLLDNARRRCSGLSNVSFENADAQVHQLPAQHFDALISRLGVMFFSDPYAAFENLTGSLRRGGRILFACWAPMDQNLWMSVALNVAKEHLGDPEPSVARAPGPFAFSDGSYVEDILTAAGLGDIGIESVPTSITSSDPAETQAELYLAVGAAFRLISAKQPSVEVIASIKRDLVTELGNHQQDGAISLGGTVVYVSATL